MMFGVAVESPVNWKPAPGNTIRRERPVLLFQEELAVAANPNCSFFCLEVSLEAAIKAKLTVSPAVAEVPPIWIWTCELEDGQLPVVLLAMVTVPEVEEPETIQWVASEAVKVINWLTAFVSDVAVTVKLEFDSLPIITAGVVAVEV